MPSRTEMLTVEQSLPGGRLDVFLRTKFPAASRGALQRLIEQGHVRVNGQTTKPTHSPRAGEEIEIHWPEARPAEAQPEAMPLDILFEDQSLLVLNKPAGLVVHPAAGHEEHTLVNALLHHCAGGLSGIGGVARPGIVHRLDKDTSGCLVVAKNDGTHLALSKQFAERRVGKIYNAIVCGELARDAGEIRVPIARHPSHRKRMAVRDDDSGRAAHTELARAGKAEGRDLCRGANPYRPHAPDSRAFPIPRPSAGGRRDLWREAKQAARGTNRLRRAARDAALARAFLHPSAHGKGNEL